MSIELTGGQLDAGDPEGQLVGVLGKISTDSGVNVHNETLGRPEHESVTNMGAVSAALSCGVMVTAIVPDWPAVSVSGSDDGETAESERPKFGVLDVPLTSLVTDAEARCVASPVYTARRE